MKILRRSEWIEETQHLLMFERPDELRGGWSFECDAAGRIDEAQLTELQRESLARARAECGPPWVVASVSRWREPAIGICDGCEQELALSDPMTNRCACGRFYNGSGQALCDPSLWGDETGEQFDNEGRPIL